MTIHGDISRIPPDKIPLVNEMLAMPGEYMFDRDAYKKWAEGVQRRMEDLRTGNYLKGYDEPASYNVRVDKLRFRYRWVVHEPLCRLNSLGGLNNPYCVQVGRAWTKARAMKAAAIWIEARLAGHAKDDSRYWIRQLP